MLTKIRLQNNATAPPLPRQQRAMRIRPVAATAEFMAI